MDRVLKSFGCVVAGVLLAKSMEAILAHTAVPAETNQVLTHILGLAFALASYLWLLERPDTRLESVKPASE